MDRDVRGLLPQTDTDTPLQGCPYVRVSGTHLTALIIKSTMIMRLMYVIDAIG